MFIIKIIKIIIVAALGIIYIPLNNLFSFVQKWYLPMKKKDIIVYYAFGPLYLILLFLTTIFTILYEKLTEGL